jgi:hypothetical protein
LTGLLAGAASFATVHDHKGAHSCPRFLFCSETDPPNGVQVSLDDLIQAADLHRIKGNVNVPVSDGEMLQKWLYFWLHLSTGARQHGTKDRARWKSVHPEGPEINGNQVLCLQKRPRVGRKRRCQLECANEPGRTFGGSGALQLTEMRKRHGIGIQTMYGNRSS